jgi:hypothetical protein
VTSSAAADDGAPRVVHQDVEPAVTVDRGLDEADGFGGVSGIELDACDAVTEGGDQVGHGVRIADCSHDLIPCDKGSLGQCTPESLRGSGDDPGLWCRECGHGRDVRSSSARERKLDPTSGPRSSSAQSDCHLRRPLS